ncbi:MAG: hypothetical protein F8N39_08895 [Clostridiaceae bacterium]|nr:hypothetical protein [Clostridiaceae bacterium]
MTLLSLIGVPKDYYNSHIIESDKTQVFLDGEFGEVIYEAVELKHYPGMKRCAGEIQVMLKHVM